MEIELSVLISVISITLAICTFVIARHKDTKLSTQEDEEKLSSIKEALLKANLKLDQLCVTTNETRNDIKSMQTTVTEHDKRLAIIERDLKTAFARIDEIKEMKK